MGSRQAERDRGHAILNKLENVCLLEKCENGKCVKMHDVIRDMAINITKKNSRFMVKTGRNLEDLPSEIEWSNNVERVSLMDSHLSTLIFVPNCPKLSTLFLQKPKFSYPPKGLHEGLPNSFFVHMLGLRILDLSCTNIAFLPDSIYDMVNLRALILCECRELKQVGSLAKLKELRELDLSWNEMETIPDGIEELVLLKHFSWISYHSRQTVLPNPLSKLLPNLLQLQCLRHDDEKLLDVGVEELSGLRKLEVLDVNFSSLHNFNSYMKTQHYQRLTHYRVRLSGREYSRLLGRKEIDMIYTCNDPTSLLDVSPSLQIATDLKACLISKCEGIKYLWCVEDCIDSLNSLFLDSLPSLRVLFKLKPTDNVRCSGLKHLYVSKCHNLKHLFTPELVKNHLQNLQNIYVRSCSQMEDIIVGVEEENINEKNNPILCFPNFRCLELVDLPKLKGIWKGTMTCDSLQNLLVLKCRKLKRLPFAVSVHINNGDGQRRASTPPLKQIGGDKEWWDGVEWDTHPHAKSVFQPLFVQGKGFRWLKNNWVTSRWRETVDNIFEEV
ncbi:putative disease resistance protein [Vitis vinifera]|uniref:Putative disease resistance protein n=1 Tax=Vitis vinifera TaxID=29760 RepID=A0A438E5G7_VITVI|nr:putative disease resistance protein [Vitis vinifera]